MSMVFFTDLCPPNSAADEPVSLRPDCSCVSSIRSSINAQRPMSAHRVVRFSPEKKGKAARHRSCSGVSCKAKVVKDDSQSNSGHTSNWSTFVSSSSMVRKRPNVGDHQVNAKCSSCHHHPLQVTSNSVCTSNCCQVAPKSCACISRMLSTNTQNSSIQSHSTVKVSNSTALPPQIRQSVAFSDSNVVSGLKVEIERMKSQLNELSCQESMDKSVDVAKQVYHLRSENKTLKRQLEGKKRLHLRSIKELESAREILVDYEKRVSLLHQQAVKSSKLMKQSKEKFCKCMREKDEKIKALLQSNEDLRNNIKGKEWEQEDAIMEFRKLHSMLNNGQNAFKENLSMCECIKDMRQKLGRVLVDSEQYKSEVDSLKQQIGDHSCEMCIKLKAKLEKHKTKLEIAAKKFEAHEKWLKNEINDLNVKLEDRSEVKALQAECDELRSKLRDYEELMERYQQAEEECKRQCETITNNEIKFERDRKELRRLVEELTMVLHENKNTLLRLSKINKEQETLLISQSAFLLEKEEQIQYAESEIQMLQKMSAELESELDDMKSAMSGPCSRTDCNNLSREIQELQIALNIERDNKLVKEKIIQDQSETIFGLQRQIKGKIEELNKAREDSFMAEEEINKINSDLMKKHRELEKELDEKGQLMKRLKKLDYQKSMLTNEMSAIETVLDDYSQLKHYDEEQRKTIDDLKKQVTHQKREWEAQKLHLAEEKEKAVKAAKFATQKLMDTVSDFQCQVNAQKKVQVMLTRMLHEKEKELVGVKEKISSINNIVTDSGSEEYTVNELYKSSTQNHTCSATPASSAYSTCTSLSKPCSRTKRKSDLTELQRVFEIITKTDEEPIRDLTR